jgi:hypothetical protein
VSWFPHHRGERAYLLPTGAGEPRALPPGPLAHYTHPFFTPDGRRLLFDGNEPGRGRRPYVQDVDGRSPPRPFAPEGLRLLPCGSPMSPDGRTVVLQRDDNHRLVLMAIDGGPERPLLGQLPDDQPVEWSPDGRFLYVAQIAPLPARAARIELATGHREEVRTFRPGDPAGVLSVRPVLATPDGRTWVFSFERVLDDLFLVEGLK